MPHQCVRCGAIYDDGSDEILKGCKFCGSKMFFYIKASKLEHMKDLTKKLTSNERKEIERDILNIIGEENSQDDSTVVLDMEAIRVLKPGKYDLDLVHLFNGDPLIYKVEDGKYIIDLTQTFQNFLKKNEKSGK